MVIQNILLVVIIVLLYAIYRKEKELAEIEKESKDRDKLNVYENSLDEEEIHNFVKSDLELLHYMTDEEKDKFGISHNTLPSKLNGEYTKAYLEDSLKDPNSEIYKAIAYVKKKDIQNNVKLELREFSTLMDRYKEFLNQSKLFKRIEVLDSLHIIKTEGGTVDDYKLFFLSEFSKLIFNNGLTFKDLEIQTDLYGYGPSTANLIVFNIQNIKEIKDGIDYKVYEADVIFTLKDKSKKTLKYQFYDDTIEEFHIWSKKFTYIDDLEDSYPYYESSKPKNTFIMVLNDLFKHLDFVGKHFYNKEFIKWNFLRYDFESLLTNDYGEYIDKSWQIDKKNFTYVEEIEKIDDINIIDSMTDDELFIYALNLYYKEYNNFELKQKVFQVVKYLDKLINNNYPMAHLVKGLLYLDGKIVLKDLSASNYHLHKAYDLGIQTPTLLIWNENDLYKNTKYMFYQK